MGMIDTHVHLDGEPAAWDPIMERSDAKGVAAWVVVGGSEAMNESARQAAGRWPDRVWPALGFDRHAADSGMADAGGRLGDLLDASARSGVRTVAIGEVGLDRHHSPRDDRAQLRVLEEQLAVARHRCLPVIVHSRDADEATLSVLGAHRARWLGDPERIGVIHSFTGDMRFAQAALELGFHIGFSGILTFRNADALRQVAAALPASRLLVETDTPYLAPVPVRGRRNEPAFVAHVVDVLARVRGEDPDRTAEQTTGNARRLFLGV
jgi:TatD DNase family protein